MIKKLSIFFLLSFFLILQKGYSNHTLNSNLSWADSVFQKLTLDQKIGQLFMLRALTQKSQTYYDSITSYIKEYQIGGLCFFQGGPVEQASITNFWQSISPVPLFVAIDAEWGLSMRLDSTQPFPRQMTLGAMANDDLVYEMGSEIAKECKRIGININFAPDVDINSNPANPVINTRSFGEDKMNVWRKALNYMQGLQNQHILAVAKHFPGHGDTDTDSHLSLPVIHHDVETIKNIDLFPFKKLFNSGIAGVMCAHLYVPALDSTHNRASSLSPAIVTDLLRNEIGYHGLVFTDALDMKGAGHFAKPGEIELKALLAGNDVLLLPENFKAAIKEIKLAIDSNLIKKEILDEKCLKILRWKEWTGLSEYKAVNLTNIGKDLNNAKSQYLNQKLFENAVTLLRNNDDILPLKRVDSIKVAVVSIGNDASSSFEERLNTYFQFSHFHLPKQATPKHVDSLVNALKPFNIVIMGVHNTNSLPQYNYGVTTSTYNFIHEVKKNNKIILGLFANPYSLSKIKDFSNIDGLYVSYQPSKVSENVTAQMIAGAINSSGKLPVTASPTFKLGSGIKTTSNLRLKYTFPEEIGIRTQQLDTIETIIHNCIKDKVFPGCQIIAIYDGKVFYQKSFGSRTYLDTMAVINNDLYDLASLTKVCATTLAVMKLYEEGKLNLDDILGNILPQAKGTNKEKLIIRDILTHQAGLKSWIPFYKDFLNHGKLDSNTFSKAQTAKYPIQVADSLYTNYLAKEYIMNQIYQSPLGEAKRYEYSDLGFILMKEVVEKISGTTLDHYVDQNFYKPLGLQTISFNPSLHFSKEQLMPTELDTVFRKQLVHGFVHDPAAAMLGGISGHAGLFANANDVAVLFQMLLNNGEYGGIRFFKTTTVKEFTKVQFPNSNNRRGLGFDKSLTKKQKSGPTCPEVSVESFGHTGFTGTYVWADPSNKFIYVFLSNRVNPDATENRLAQLGIRTQIQQIFYNLLKKSDAKKYSQVESNSDKSSSGQ